MHFLVAFYILSIGVLQLQAQSPILTDNCNCYCCIKGSCPADPEQLPLVGSVPVRNFQMIFNLPSLTSDVDIWTLIHGNLQCSLVLLLLSNIVSVIHKKRRESVRYLRTRSPRRLWKLSKGIDREQHCQFFSANVFNKLIPGLPDSYKHVLFIPICILTAFSK